MGPGSSLADQVRGLTLTSPTLTLIRHNADKPGVYLAQCAALGQASAGACIFGDLLACKDQPLNAAIDLTAVDLPFILCI